ncbi:Pyruvate kinase [Halapricum desulfuricans]|uniref:Pyruvate kinase n=1 Tax=Halapricum desulfuricans TaxID=2841257 RepID=A0A897NJU1_9EURY|nr:pyruvate kinase [Halapricum desulfuricans]QSG13012.1 Pyruvate kinase [Halapricum desulfuricans]
MRNAKIVCTLGPASDSLEGITDLAEAGMSVARLNASHGSPEERRETIARVREVDQQVDHPVAVMHDIPGPEVRTADIDEPIHLAADSRVRFYQGDDATPDAVGLSLDISAVEPGDRVLLDDGRIETTVEDVDGSDVYARVENGGKLQARKGVNIPGVELGLPTVTEKDRQELKVAAEEEVDLVAASFVRDGADIREIADTLNEFGADIPIVAKIERAGAVQNLDSIIDEAYGIMVARGDLGVELPLEVVPLYQKRIIRKCNEAGVPVITATEMLDSMVEARRPTRAEASDVANAVLDGTDAVMLSGETAIGDHPARVVDTMASIVEEVEHSEEYETVRQQRIPEAEGTRADALAHAARFLAEDVDAAAIVAASESGHSALKMAKFRPCVPIIASTPNDRVRRRLALSWGIHPTTIPRTTEGADAIIQNAAESALDTGIVRDGDRLVVMSGMMTELEGIDSSNMLKIHVAAETTVRGDAVVGGLVTGELHRVEDGDLSTVPEGAIAVVSEYSGELAGDAEHVRGIVGGERGMKPGSTSHAAVFAREHGIPMIADVEVPDELEDGTVVTLDAEKAMLYRDAGDDSAQ